MKSSLRSRIGVTGATLTAAIVAVAVWRSALPAAAQTRGRGPHWDIKVRSVDVPDSCVQSVFRPEVRVVNNATESRDLSEILVRAHFNAPRDGLESVTAFVFAAISDAQGGVVGFSQATANQFVRAVGQCELTPDRKTNQAWNVFFTPAMVPAGGSATFIVTLRRQGGLSPFDAECDDFTKVEPNGAFHDDVHYGLFFASAGLGIRACEFISPLIVDPNRGIDPCSGANDCSADLPQ
jgi:hypothetical protein